jgi:hypothetical protein
LISNADLPKCDAAHYNTQGQILLGERFAKAYLELIGQAAEAEEAALPAAEKAK